MRAPTLLAALLLAAPAPVKAPKPRIVLYVFPQAGHAPLQVDAHAVARDPGRVLSCPEVIWEWGDGLRETRAADCADPYGGPETRPDRYDARPPAPHVYGLRGDLTLRVTFMSMGRPYVAERTVMVR